MGVLTLSTHRALELPVGLAVAVVPLVAGASAFGTVVCVILGALIVTLALSTNREGQALAGAAHVSSDRVLAAVLAGAAVVLAVLGQSLPAGLCAAGAVAMALLTLFTSYVERPGRDDETRATTITAG